MYKPRGSNEKKNIKITDAKDLLELALTRLTQLIGKISILHGNMHLDIYERNTSSSSLNFNYTEVSHLLNEIKKKSQLSDKLIEGFFGKLRERLGKNLRTGDIAIRITNCTFTSLLSHIVTKEQDAV